MPTPRRTLLIAFLVVLAATGFARADEGEAGALTITVGGEARTVQALRRLEEETRKQLKDLGEAPATDEKARKLLVETITAQAAAFADAAALLERVGSAPQTQADLEKQVAEKRRLLAERQQAAAAEPVVSQPIDDERVKELEAKAKEAARTAAEAARLLEEASKQKVVEPDAIDARLAELEARRAKLASDLAALPDDAVRDRDVLQRQLQTNEARLGLLGVQQARRGTLVALDKARMALGQVEADLAAADRALAEAVLARARERYQERLKAESEAAIRKQRQAEAEARRAEREGSLAEKATAKLKVLVSRMQVEEAADRGVAGSLKPTRDDGIALLRAATTRLDSVKIVFPPGRALEPWQQEVMAERLRQLESDRDEFDSFRDSEQVRDLDTVLASALVRRGKLEILGLRLTAAKERFSRGDSDDARVVAIEAELQRSRDADYRLWLEARLDFLGALKERDLGESAKKALESEWTDLSAALDTAIGKRTAELEQQKANAEELRTALASTDAALLERRRHLNRVAFWLRGDPLYSPEALGRMGADAGHVGAWVAAIPEQVGDLQPAGTTPLLVALLLALLVIAVGLKLRGAPRAEAVLEGTTRGSAVAPPDAAPAEEAAREELDEDDRRAATLRRGSWQVVRQLAMPLGSFLVALYVRSAVLGDAAIVTVALAVLAAWTAGTLWVSVRRTFLTPDANGVCLAGCSIRTALRARRCLWLLLAGSAFFFAALLVFRAADAAQFARLTSTLWGLLGVALGVLLVVWRDVLRLLVPVRRGGLLGRTLLGAVRLLLPAIVLLGAGVLAMYVFGYHRASAFYSSRALYLLVALAAIVMAHSLLKLWLQRRFEQEPVDEDAPNDRVDMHLAQRFLGGTLTLAVLAGAVFAVSLVFGMTWVDWQAIGAISITGGEAGAGLTLGKLTRAALIFVIGLRLARYLRDVLRVALRSSGLHMGSRYAMRTLFFYTMVFVGTLMALAALGVEMEQFGWFLTAAGVGIGFGLQEIISNFISGLILFFERPVQVGDIVSVGDVQGDVTRISIRSTVVRTRDGVAMILPNKKLITEDVVNWSHGDQRTRLNLEIGVAYGSDVKLVRKLLLQVAADERLVVPRPPPEVDFTAFGDSALVFTLRVWLATPDISARRRVRTSIHTHIDAAFNEHGIVIPFPQRDLHLKSSGIGRLAGPADAAPEPDAPA